MSRFVTKQVGEVADIRRGASPRPIDEWMADNGIPWVKISDATKTDSRFIYATEGFIREEGKDKSVEVYPEDLIISNSATPGLPRIMKIHACIHDGWLLAENFKGITRDYLFYQIKYMRKYLVNQGNGSIFTNLKTDILKEFPIQMPIDKEGNLDEKTQTEIVSVLWNIEDKMENNSAICSNLEAMAKLLYDYWFLQFDFPDENGKPYKSSGGKMVWNEELKREIPEGWEVGKIGDLITTERGISYSTPNISTGKGVPMLNLATFMPGGGDYKADGLKHYLGDYPQNKVLNPYELIMCNTQQTAIKFETDIIGRAMLVPDIFEGDVVFSHHVNVIRTQDDNLKYYLLFLFNSDYFHKYISGFTNGTNILGLSFNGVEDFQTTMPPTALREKFGRVVLEAEKKKSEIMVENQQLASLRDFLLPMLMNGQAKVGKESA